MKLQHLAVIFVVIILPIALVLSVYTGNLISVVNAQSSYDSLLLNSTYDAVRAYQMNTLQNAFESEMNSKVRDVNASINTFFNSLALGFSSSSLSKTELTDYIPAILYTLYDGYYVYGVYDNIVNTREGIKYSREPKVNKRQYGLKPYIYYTCEYEDEGKDYDLIVNYTLDNYIAVTGTYKDPTTLEQTTISKSGYYVDWTNIAVNPDGKENFNSKTVTLKGGAGDVIIAPEKLGEYLITLDEFITIEGTPEKPETKYNYEINDKEIDPSGTITVKPRYYNYITYNGVKYYLDDEIDIERRYEEVKKEGTVNISFNQSYVGIPIFFLDRDTRIYISESTFNELKSYLGIDEDDRMFNANDGFRDVNAYYYYYNAVNFSKSAYPALSQINLGLATVDGENVIASNVPYREDGSLIEGNVIKTETYHINYTNELGVETHIKTTYPHSDVFTIYEDNNPELDSSSFNMHRMDVIISSIESSLVSTIANFNSYVGSGYAYTMPVLSENEWNEICNNMTVLSFMQGLTIGNYKYYNKYALVANTKVKDFVSKNSIYLQDGAEYHNPRCLEYNDNINHTSASVIGYPNISYEKQNCTWLQHGNTVYYYYLRNEEAAYECMVGQNSNQFSTDDLMEGTNVIEGIEVNNEVRRAYITALAREREGSYKTYGFLNGEI